MTQPLQFHINNLIHHMGPNSATTTDLLSLLHFPKCSLPPPHHPSSMLPNSSISLERERRVHLNNCYMALKSLIPNPTKDDRASIVGEAIDYIKELLRAIEELKRLVENKRFGRCRGKKKAIAGEGGENQEKEEDDVVNYKQQSEVDQSWLKRKSKVTEVNVLIIDDEVTIKLVQKKKINCLLFTTKVLDQLQLDLHHVSGGQNGDHYSFLFNTKIFEGSCVYASGVADTVMEVMEKQYMEAVPSNGERRKKNESPGKRGDSSLHISARTGNLGKVKEVILGCGDGGWEELKELLSKQNLAEKIGNAELVSVLKEAGAATAKDLGKPQNPAKQLKQTVSDIKHEVQSQLQQSRQTGVRVQEIAKRLKKLHVSGLNNAINSATVVAVLIATVAFAAIFTIPGQYEEDKLILLGQAQIANKAPFLVFFIFDSLALFISLAVVVVQTSVVVIEQKAKKKLVFVINKLMWCACLFISIAFASLSYISLLYYCWRRGDVATQFFCS